MMSRVRCSAFVRLVILSCIVYICRAQAGITNFSFDDKKLIFSISWKIDTAFVKKETRAGLTISTDPKNSDPPVFSFSVDTATDDTIMKIDLINRFDTLLYAALWLSNEGVWTKVDSVNQMSVRVSSLYRQPLSLFNSNQDTVKVLQRGVWIWKDKTYPEQISMHYDTIVSYGMSKNRLKGFVQVAAAVRFLNPVPMPRVCVGIQYQPLKKGLCETDIQIYRDSSGFLFAEKSAVRDTLQNIIYFSTTHLEQGFTLLIDTLKPRVVIKSDISKNAISSDVTDTVMLYDNCSNLDWQFYSGIGQSSFLNGKMSGTMHDTVSRLILPISVSGANDGGIHAVLFVSDGINEDTIDLSRSVIRTSHMILTNDNMVTPVFATSVLDSNKAGNCLSSLFNECGGVYDRKQFRLFRWYTNASNVDSEDKWVEYSSKNSDDFKFKPGVLFWLHTATQKFIDLGSGTTVSLREPFVIKLQPKTWTDFGIPFNRKIPLKEVFAISSENSIKISIYSWKKNVRESTYEPACVYAGPAVSDTTLPDTLFPGAENCYTAFNPSDSIVQLQLPAHPTIERNDYFLAKRSVKNSKIVKITVSDESGVRGIVYFGESDIVSEPQMYPYPAVFTKPVLTLQEVETGKKFGTVILANNSINKKATDIACIITNSKAERKHYTISFLRIPASAEAVEKKYEFDINAKESINIPLDSMFNRKGYNFAPVYREGIKPRITSTGKNRIVIDMANAGVNSHYRLEIFNLDGKRESVYPLSRNGNSNLYYIGLKKYSSGVKLVRMIESTDQGRTCTVFANTITVR